MPFTVSHVAAVLPVVGRSTRLPAAALVIGSMAPDYPWFLTRGRTSWLSHTPLGVVTVDLAVGLLAFMMWRRWAQAPVRDLVPRTLGEHLGLPGYTLAQYLSGLLGLLALVVWGLRHLEEAVPDDTGLHRTVRDRRTAWGLLVAGTVVGALVGMLRAGPFAESVLFGAVTLGGAGLAVGVVLGCALWWTRAPRPAEAAERRG